MYVYIGRAVLPLHINPREGWRGGKLLGQGDSRLQAELNQEKVLRLSIIRTRDGFKQAVSDYPSGKLADIIDYESALLEYQEEKRSTGALRITDGSLAIGSRVMSENNSHSGTVRGVISTHSHSTVSVKTGMNSPQNSVGPASGKASVTGGLSMLTASCTSVPDAGSGVIVSSKSHTPMDMIIGERSGFSEEEGSWDGESDDGTRDGTDVEESSHHSHSHPTSHTQLSHPISSSTSSHSATLHIPSAHSYIVHSNSIEYIHKTIDDNDDVLLDCRDVVHDIGKSTHRQIHALNLRSAYEYYGCAGE